MDDAEVASYDAWLGGRSAPRCGTYRAPVGSTVPANRVGPALVTESDDAAFWLHCRSLAFDGLGRTVESTRSVCGHEAA